jgi:hypothetical protein
MAMLSLYKCLSAFAVFGFGVGLAGPCLIRNGIKIGLGRSIHDTLEVSSAFVS